MNSNIADLLLFAVVNTTNILTFFLFVSRVKWPSAGHKLAIATVFMAIPAAIVVVLNATAGREWLYWIMPLIFIAWAILTLIVDIIRNIEFRQPRKLNILVPFLLLFYIGMGGMGILTWRISFTLWTITAVTFALQFIGT
ncbi:hypothetical protein ACFLWM_01900, partial [Chloroflexota bacterium]